MNLIVDCSFIMSSFLPDENNENIDNIYHQIIQNKYKVYASAIFFLECSNVLAIALRRKRITDEQFNEYVNLLSLLPINIDKFCASPEALYIIGNLARKYNLTTYDASYLEIAMRMEAAIATLDNNLINISKALNIKTVVSEI